MNWIQKRHHLMLSRLATMREHIMSNWRSMTPEGATVLFICAFITNIFWVLTQRRIGQGIPLQAGVSSFFLSVCALSITYIAVRNVFYIPVAALGYAFGSYVGVTLDVAHKLDWFFRWLQ